MALLTSRRLLVVALPVVLVFALRAPAAIPGGDDPKAFTQHDLLKARLAFNKRTLAGAYNAVGDRDPTWDGAAVRLLDAMAVYFTYGSAEPIYKTVDVPTWEALGDLAKAAADAGCTDPMVAYCRSVILLDQNQRDAGLPILRGCVTELARRKYPPHRVSAAAVRDLRAHPGDRRFSDLAWESTLAMADTPPDAGDLRFLLAAIDFGDLALPRKRDFCTALEARPSADRWIVNVLWGRYEIAAAWDARGSGVAGTVTDDGWKGFFDHLTQARDRLVKAHAFHPEFPEAAAEMIPVAMGAGERLNTTTREWFDMAARAQLDYYPAYENYVYSLWPRWGGSHAEMLRFGIECMETGRWDTYVPFQLWRYVEQVNAETGGEFAVLKDPQVQVAVHQLLTSMGQKAGGREPRETYESMLAGVKWRTGDYAAAATLLDKLGERAVPGAFEHLLAWGPLAISEVRAMTSPHAAALTAARASADSGDAVAAAEAYTAVEAKLGKEDPAYLFVHHRATAMRLERAFAAGGWVDITPDETLAPWTPRRGEWNRERDGAITGIAFGPVGRSALVCRADFGHDYELRAHVSLPDPKVHSIPSLFVRWINDDSYMAAQVDTARSILWARHAQGQEKRPVALKGGDLITVRVEGEIMSILVDDKPLLTDQPVGTPAAGLTSYVALGIDSAGWGKAARFTGVQIRRLGAGDGGKAQPAAK